MRPSDLQRGWGFPTSLSGHCAAWVIKPAGEARAEPVVGLGNPVEPPRPCARSTARGGGSPTYRLAATRLLLVPQRCNVVDLGMCVSDRSLTADRLSRARRPPCPKGEPRLARRPEKWPRFSVATDAAARRGSIGLIRCSGGADERPAAEAGQAEEGRSCQGRSLSVSESPHFFSIHCSVPPVRLLRLVMV